MDVAVDGVDLWVGNGGFVVSLRMNGGVCDFRRLAGREFQLGFLQIVGFWTWFGIITIQLVSQLAGWLAVNFSWDFCKLCFSGRGLESSPFSWDLSWRVGWTSISVGISAN
jgi:hypothetical protein